MGLNEISAKLKEKDVMRVSLIMMVMIIIQTQNGRSAAAKKTCKYYFINIVSKLSSSLALALTWPGITEFLTFDF